MLQILLRALLLAGLSGLLIACSGSSDSISPAGEEPGNPAPDVLLDLSADDETLEAGGSTTLRWTATNATSCQANGDWSGPRSVAGTEPTGVLNQASTFELSCSNATDTSTAAVTVQVNPAPPPPPPPPPPDPPPPDPPPPSPAPTLTFNAADALVDRDGDTTLSWSSENADTCAASATGSPGTGWSGNRPPTGSELVGPIGQPTSFTLNCTGPGGSALSIVSVSVMGTVTLAWEAPTQNVDGSALTDLAAYRVYWGSNSRAYTDQQEIPDPATLTISVDLPAGDYFFAMTAVDSEDNESAYSNEVLKSAN